MSYMLPILLIAAAPLSIWGVTKGNSAVRFGSSVGLFCLGAYLGSSWQIMRNFETYIIPFDQYSWRLYDLAERKDIRALTNDVEVFYKSFNGHEDPAVLEDVVHQMLGVGKYSQGTNFGHDALQPARTEKGR